MEQVRTDHAGDNAVAERVANERQPAQDHQHAEGSARQSNQGHFQERPARQLELERRRDHSEQVHVPSD